MIKYLTISNCKEWKILDYNGFSLKQENKNKSKIPTC